MGALKLAKPGRHFYAVRCKRVVQIRCLISSSQERCGRWCVSAAPLSAASCSSPRPYPVSLLPYTSGCGGVSPLLLMLSARPSACSVGEGSPAAGALGGASRRGMGFFSRAVSLDDEAPSSSAAGYDLSARYLSVRIRCRKEDAEFFSESLLCFGACSVTVDDIANAANLDEESY
ncbi:hypothetical protein ACQ4PT_009934 [Festuca glaucescens]